MDMLSIIGNKEQIKIGDIIATDASKNSTYVFNENDCKYLYYGIIVIRVTKIWNDFETGIHFKGEIMKECDVICKEAKLYKYSTFGEFDEIYYIK